MTFLLFLLSLFLWETDDDDGDGDRIKDPEALARAQRERADRFLRKLRKEEKRSKELEERIAALEAGDDTDDDDDAPDRPDADALRIENLFMRSVLARGGNLDTETAWTLLREHGFIDAVNADEPEEMTDALDKLVNRYPWLESEPGESEDRTPPPPPPSGGRARKRKDSSRAVDTAQLGERFPALRGRR